MGASGCYPTARAPLALVTVVSLSTGRAWDFNFKLRTLRLKCNTPGPPFIHKGHNPYATSSDEY